MSSGLARFQPLFLSVLLVLPLAAGDAAERRAGDCTAPRTQVLRVSKDTLALLKILRPEMAEAAQELYPVLPVEPLDVLVVGRLFSAMKITRSEELLSALAVFTAKIAETHGGAVQGQVAATPAVPNQPPEWLQELNTRTNTSPQDRIGYLHLEDPLHPNSMSRFHFIVRRIPFQSPLGLPAGMMSGYSIMDLGSLNGVYCEGMKLPAHRWTPLANGVSLRFAPMTKRAKAYLDRIHKAAEANTAPDFTGLAALEAMDVHMQLDFVAASEAESQAARESWLRQAGVAAPAAQEEPEDWDMVPHAHAESSSSSQSGAAAASASSTEPGKVQPKPDDTKDKP
jgi:hypothetical protein